MEHFCGDECISATKKSVADVWEIALSDLLGNCCIQLCRMKTGTRPRILGSTIDFQKCAEQIGDSVPQKFGFYDSRGDVKIIDKCPDFFNLRSPDGSRTRTLPRAISSGKIYIHRRSTPAKFRESDRATARGWRSNMRNFPTRTTIDCSWNRKATARTNSIKISINELSTSLPIDVQAIPGLEHVQIVRPAYALEYDYAPPTQLNRSLESNVVN
jgi:tRNA uridine 5-carboxymethylaminomethyl modification enzyme